MFRQIIQLLEDFVWFNISSIFRGLWNMALVSGTMLIKREVLPTLRRISSNKHLHTESSTAISEIFREKVKNFHFKNAILLYLSFSLIFCSKGIFIYATNMHHFGHLVNTDTFNTSRIRPEFYEVISNLHVCFTRKNYIWQETQTTATLVYLF